jgi:hypothetical protein
MLEEKKSGKIWLNIFLVLLYMFVFFVLLFNSFSYLDPDFGWHMKIGEQIWQTGAVPNLNYGNFTLEGRTWVDHEWLMNLITYGLYHNFGYIGASIFFALLIIAVLIIQLQFVRRNFLTDDRGLIFFLALQAFGLYASLPHLGIRMQEITILCLLLLFVIIFYYNKGAVAERRPGLNSHILTNFFKSISADMATSPLMFFKKFPQNMPSSRAQAEGKNLYSESVKRQPPEKNYRILFWLLPLFLFWASAHAGFLVGLFILGLFVFVKLFEVLAKKFFWNFIDYGRSLTLRQIGIFSGFSLAALAVTLITPYGPKLYGFLFGYKDAFYQTHICEWQGQFFFPFEYPQLIYAGIVSVFLALLFFTVFVFKSERRRKIDLWGLFLVVFFLFLTIKARRHFPLLFIVSLPVLTFFFIDFFGLRFGFFNKTKIGQRSARLYSFFIPVVLFFSCSLVALNIDFVDQPERRYKNEYPYEAVMFLRAHPEFNGRRIFNEYGWGGYLIWQYPGQKLFIDGRLPQYELNGSTMLKEYYSFFNKEEAAAKLKKYGIDLVFLRIKSSLPKIHWWEKEFFGITEEKLVEVQKEEADFRNYFLNSPDWQDVYNDGLAEIFVKKN